MELGIEEGHGQETGENDHTPSQHLEAGSVGPRKSEVHGRGRSEITHCRDSPNQRVKLLRAKFCDVLLGPDMVVVPSLEDKETRHLSHEHQDSLEREREEVKIIVDGIYTCRC